MIPESEFNAEALLAGILPWVEVESPTWHVAGVNRMMDLAAAEVQRLGGTIERVPGVDGAGDIVIGRFPGADPTAGKGILVLSHLDTVHLVGTLADKLPIRRQGNRCYGPGIYDMKGGVRIALHAFDVVRRLDRSPRLPVTFMFVPDEEVGSPTSRARIEAEAKAHKYVLVTEPCKNGVIVTGRFAFQRFWVETKGRPAHAGANNRDGRSAIRAMASLVERIEGMTDFTRGMTFSVGTIEGGTFVNVMPISCRAQVLTVAPNEPIFHEVRERMMALAIEHDGVTISVTQGPVRPLWSPHMATMALYERARLMSAELGFDLRHGSFGGGSDGNFTGALGVATLDGLGVDGAGAHTFEEHLLVSSLPRSRLLAELLARLD
ncbi:MAG TPA: M20/M25/M40 family metallo-hydrolase [Hyphomicrobiaceae bacterium]|nr:M20/M25/M40 family metallo-hydrolase [Hyphomicrobiaceae bacterium]